MAICYNDAVFHRHATTVSEAKRFNFSAQDCFTFLSYLVFINLLHIRIDFRFSCLLL